MCTETGCMVDSVAVPCDWTVSAGFLVYALGLAFLGVLLWSPWTRMLSMLLVVAVGLSWLLAAQTGGFVSFTELRLINGYARLGVLFQLVLGLLSAFGVGRGLSTATGRVR